MYSQHLNWLKMCLHIHCLHLKKKKFSKVIDRDVIVWLGLLPQPVKILKKKKNTGKISD